MRDFTVNALFRTVKTSLAFLLFFTCYMMVSASEGVAEDKFVTIGTGGVTGVYYPTGGAICRLVNRKRKEHGIRCSVESTGGSIYNLNALRDGGMDLGICQSDWQYHATKGSSFFEDKGPFKELRSLFSLHTEAFTIVVRADSGIKKLDDLINKRVNIGNPGSGNRATMEVLMNALGWTKESFSMASELRGSEQPQALCDNKIDVMVYSAGHPNGAVQEVATSCDVRLIPVVGPGIDQLVKNYPYYAYTMIPGGTYAGNPDNIKTFGVKATLVTTSNLSEDVVYEIVKSVFDNFDNFKRLHPVFANLDPRRLMREGNSAPLHKGAEKYYKERGLL